MCAKNVQRLRALRVQLGASKWSCPRGRREITFHRGGTGARTALLGRTTQTIVEGATTATQESFLHHPGRHVLSATTKSVAVPQVAMQARTFLHNVRLGLLVIPVHAQLVLLGQIMLLLPTKVHAQPARHVLWVGKPPLLVQQRQILVHVLIVMRGSTEPGRLRLPRHVLPAITKLVAVLL